MRIGSLFSGIGGLELGLERAGVGRTVWQVEKDEWCRRVLAKHWPDAARYEDVTLVDWSTVETVEVLCGGFPCQDISLAGKGAGLAGERSGLWRWFAGAVRDLRPRFVVVENVAALLARGLGDVLADLAACGYDTEWDCIPAAAVGAPHRRDRLFVIAHTDRDGVRLEPVTVGGRSGASVADVNGPDGHVADADGPRRATGESGWWSIEPDVGRVAHGVPRRVDRLRGLGNAVVPAVAEVVGARLMELV